MLFSDSLFFKFVKNQPININFSLNFQVLSFKEMKQAVLGKFTLKP